MLTIEMPAAIVSRLPLWTMVWESFSKSRCWSVSLDSQRDPEWEIGEALLSHLDVFGFGLNADTISPSAYRRYGSCT